jgi:putative FmdB family regulatory protein
MGFYDYKCDKCKKVKEVSRKITEEDMIVICDVCGEKMHVIISKSSFKLKNGKSGWASNGYSDVKQSGN